MAENEGPEKTPKFSLQNYVSKIKEFISLTTVKEIKQIRELKCLVRRMYPN